MRRIISVTTGCLLTTVVLLSGCTDDLMAPDTVEPSTTGVVHSAQIDAQMLADQRQAVLHALNNGTPSGAIVDQNVGLFDCFFFVPFFDEGGVAVAVLGVFPFGQNADCSGLKRTNPDGTQDRYLRGSGSVLLIIPEFVSSQGSDARWQLNTTKAEGAVFNARGTLGDGRKFRLHQAFTPTGETPSNFFWLEGTGYVVSPG